MKKFLLTFLFISLSALCFAQSMTVTSTAVNINGILDDKYGYNDKTKLDSKGMPIYSIPFQIHNPPKNTVSYALVLEDKDAFPVSHGFSWIHWVAANITVTNVKANASKNKPDFVQGVNSWWSSLGGSRNENEVSCYGGPAPYDHKEHIYELHIYALDKILNLKNGFLMNQLYRQMENHILAEYTLKFKYKLKD